MITIVPYHGIVVKLTGFCKRVIVVSPVSMKGVQSLPVRLQQLLLFFAVLLGNPIQTLSKSDDVVTFTNDDMYYGEWGALAPKNKVSRKWRMPADNDMWPSFDPNLGRKQREEMIVKYADSNVELDERLVADYFVELQYENSDNVVVSRPKEENTAALDRAYDNMRIRLQNTRYNDVRPGPNVYYIPKNASILSKTIKELNAAGTMFLIRGGGHSYEATTLPTSDNAAVIDMAKFTSMVVSDSEIVGKDGMPYRELTFGPGLRLATMYLYLAKRNLALIAGTCPTNGASGYYLGGGAGPSMRKVGWGSDQIIRAKVILADGSFAVADSDDKAALPGQAVSPSNLLFALRGGGAGTAVVYEYTIRAYNAPEKVTRCRLEFSTPTKADYQTFVTGWSNDWKIWELDGQQYPFIRIYSRLNVSAIVMDSWSTSPDDLASDMLQGMSNAKDIVLGEPTCSETGWVDFLFDTFASYYASVPEIQEALVPENYTTSGLLAMNYIGWGYAGSNFPNISPPLSPYANFDVVAPTVNGPNSFSAQGIVSSKTWDSDIAGKLWDAAISKGLRFYSYALGGKLQDDQRGAATDDTVGSAMDALSHGKILTVTDVAATNQAQMDLSLVVAGVLDEYTVSRQPSRYYNFINCYNNTDSSTLFMLYYGEDVSKKLVDIKAQADPQSRLETWCNV